MLSTLLALSLPPPPPMKPKPLTPLPERRASASSPGMTVRGAVGASTHPTATFVLTEPVTLPAGLATGETVAVDAVGDLTVNGVTNSTTFTINALVRDDGFGVITGSTNIVFEDFDVTAPSAAIVVSVDDNGIVEFQLIVAKG